MEAIPVSAHVKNRKHDQESKFQYYMFLSSKHDHKHKVRDSTLLSSLSSCKQIFNRLNCVNLFRCYIKHFRSAFSFGRKFLWRHSIRGLQRDVVYLGWPIAPSYMSPNAGGGGGELRGLSQLVQLYTGAQINFGDLTPYLTYAFN